MKHSINLYLEDLRPKVYYLTLANLSLLALVVVGSFSALLASTYFDIEKIQQQNQQLTTLKNNAQTQLEKLQQELVKHNDKATFNNQKLQLEKNLQAKQMLWEGVGKRIETSTVNYYHVMKDLTEHHDHDVWLSSFQVGEKEAAFSGFSLNSGAVTRWMTYLQSSDSFKGREFSHLNVKAIDERVLQFQIATSPLLLQEGEQQ